MEWDGEMEGEVIGQMKVGEKGREGKGGVYRLLR